MPVAADPKYRMLIDWDGGDLTDSFTQSGDVLNDAVRLAARTTAIMGQGDGEPDPASSMGVYPGGPTNLLASNHSLEVNTNNYFASNGATITRVNSLADDGSWSLKVDCDPTQPNSGVGLSHLNAISALTASRLYCADIPVNGPVGARIEVQIDYSSGAGYIATIYQEFTLTGQTDATSGFERLVLTGISPATADRCFIYVRSAGSPAQAITFYIDNVYFARADLLNLHNNPSARFGITGASNHNLGVVTHETALGCFGFSSFKVTTPGSSANEGCSFTIPGPVASTPYASTVRIKAPIGSTIRIQLDDVDGSTSGATIVGNDDWQEHRVNRTVDASPGSNLILYIRTVGTSQAIVFHVDGVQTNPYAQALPFNEGRRALGRLQGPAADHCNQTTMWVSMLLEMGWNHNALPIAILNAFPQFFHWMDNGNDGFIIDYDATVGTFRALVTNGSFNVASIARTFNRGDLVPVTVAFNATQIKIKAGASSITTITRTQFPTVSASLYDLMSGGSVYIGRESFSKLRYIAMGTGISLTDTQINAIHALTTLDDRYPHELSDYNVSMVSWLHDYYFDPIDDVSLDLMDFSTARGRDQASQLLGRSNTGEIAGQLLNLDGQYNPLNSVSPYFGLLNNGLMVRVYIDTTILQTGFLDDIVPTLELGNIPVASFTAKGQIVKLGDRVSPLPLNDPVMPGDVIHHILDASAYPGYRRSIQDGQTPIERWFGFDTASLELLRQIEDTELGFLWEGKEGNINFDDRHYRIRETRSTVTNAVFTDQEGDDLGYKDVVQEQPISQIFNQVTLDTVGYEEDIAPSVLWTYTGPAITVPPLGVVSIVAQISGDNYVSEWITPTIAQTPASADIVYLNGTLAVDVNIPASDPLPFKTAKTMTIRLSNSHTSQNAIVQTAQARGILAMKGQSTRVQKSDSMSQTKFGKRLYAFPSVWHSDANLAQDYADYIVNKYKNPIPFITFNFPARKTASFLAQAKDRDLSDRITFIANNGTNLGISGDFFIERIEHVIPVSGDHWVTFVLSPVDIETEFWIMDEDLLGVGTVLGY